MNVTYTGPLAAVVLADTGLVVARGATVEVADELGQRLTRQKAWTEAAAPVGDKPDDSPAKRGRKTAQDKPDGDPVDTTED